MFIQNFELKDVCMYEIFNETQLATQSQLHFTLFALSPVTSKIRKKLKPTERKNQLKHKQTNKKNGRTYISNSTNTLLHNLNNVGQIHTNRNETKTIMRVTICA